MSYTYANFSTGLSITSGCSLVSVIWCIFSSISTSSAYGGAIAVNNSQISLYAVNSFFCNCTCVKQGAGIYVQCGPSTISYDCFYLCSAATASYGYGCAISCITGNITCSYVSACACPGISSTADNGVLAFFQGVKGSNHNSSLCRTNYASGVLIFSNNQTTDLRYVGSFSHPVGQAAGFEDCNSSCNMYGWNIVNISSSGGCLFLWSGNSMILNSFVFIDITSFSCAIIGTGQSICLLNCYSECAFSTTSGLLANISSLIVTSQVTQRGDVQLGLYSCKGSATGLVTMSCNFSAFEYRGPPLLSPFLYDLILN